MGLDWLDSLEPVASFPLFSATDLMNSVDFR